MQAADTQIVDDAILLRRYAQAADREAMDELFRRHTASAYRLARHISKNDADAEEIVQSVFLDVLRSATSYRGEAGVKVWIMQMIANKSISRIREDSRRRNREQTAMEQRPTAESPTGATANQDQQVAVREHLAQLPDHYRLPIYLRYMEGMSTKEVASTLSLTEKTVYSQIERGVALLQRSLSVAGFTTTAVALPAVLSAVSLEGPPPALARVVADLVAKTPPPGPSLGAGHGSAISKPALAKLAIAIPGIAVITAGGIALLLHVGSASTATQPPPATPPASNSALKMPVRLATINLAADGMALQNRYAYCTSTAESKLYVLDISDPKSAKVVGAGIQTQSPAPNVVRADGQFLYVLERGAAGRLEIFDISNPTMPAALGSVALSSPEPHSLDIQGNFAYVLQADGAEVAIYDISNRRAPALAGTARLEHNTTNLQVQGHLLFTGGPWSNSGYLAVLDASNPKAPTLIGSTNGWQYPNCVWVRDHFVYWPSGNHKLIVVDISEPSKPALVNATGPGFLAPRTIASNGRMLWIVDRSAQDNDQIQTFDLSDPSKPRFICTFNLGIGGTRSIAVQGRHLFAANGSVVTAFDLRDLKDSGGPNQ